MLQVVVFGTLLGQTAVVIVSAFFLALYLPGVSSVVLSSASTSIQRRELCELSLQWDICLPGGPLSPPPPPPKLTQVRWQSFDVRKRFLLLALSHQFTSVQPLTQSVIKSERVLCVFRSEQFASSFTNSVRQKELRYIISHHCFSWAVDQLSSLMASELLNCTVGEKVLF